MKKNAQRKKSKTTETATKLINKCSAGELEIQVPQDRKSEFEPKIVPKYKKDISEIEQKIINMYAGGLGPEQHQRSMPPWRQGQDQFLRMETRFKIHGLEGLKDMPPIPKNPANQTPPEIEAKILETSLKYPAWGCVKLSVYFKLQGISISSPTVQKILMKNGMASQYDRFLRLEEKHFSEGIELTAEQVAKIEKFNPCFKERYMESSRPGELLSQDTFYVGIIRGKVYLHAAVDTFGFLHTGKKPECAAALIHNDVLPFYEDHGLSLDAVITNNAPEFCDTQNHPFELYLALNDIEHRRTKVRAPRSNGFIERFSHTVLNEFFKIAFRENFYESVDALQAVLEEWLVFLQ